MSTAETLDQPRLITEPGLIHAMSDEEYHADPLTHSGTRSLSSSLARRLTDYVPAKAIAAGKWAPTASMNIGKVAHLKALGVGPQLVVWQHDGRTKAGKEERLRYAADIAAERVVAVTEAERDQVDDMILALRAHPEVAELLDTCDPEVSAFWQERGTWCRARIDLLGPAAWDYKSALDVSLPGFESSMAKYGYHQQEDFYRRGLRAIGHPAGKERMRFICQEKTAPYLVQIHTPDDLAAEVAAHLNDRALDLFADGLARDAWDGYPSLRADDAALPGWYFRQLIGVIPEHLNPDAEPEMSI